jgi:hypothetical protein
VFGLNSLSDLPKLREIDDLLKTTTTMIDMDETISIQTDHRTLRKQLALLLDGDQQTTPSDTASSEATSGAYWQQQDDDIVLESVDEESTSQDDTLSSDDQADSNVSPS